MKACFIVCSYCKKSFSRPVGQINEANKFGWRQFCSKDCHSFEKTKTRNLQCSNPQCRKSFKRRTYKNTIEVYCSRSCAASINNSKFPKKHAVIKNCSTCNKYFKTNQKYCSLSCKNKGQSLSREYIIKEIKEFFIKTGRIPLKREFYSYSAARNHFVNWNNAIKAAGFDPNPVMFAKKYIANDGHKCDSLAEKIIDDWLYARAVTHKRSIAYPDNYKLTVDFLIGNYWIEFFGLFGQHRRYDELRKEKLKIAKANNMSLIEIYPKDLFPVNKLDQILAVLQNSI
ncbi:MAG: hypothetical protein A2152_01390 [Candidatus Levybacteria bacterium RBG_16_35_6]|nr:MAG: hypothetical protein A2152_01390 [Candidatus Levybacteria bacterium RBG_16_35_6]